MEFNAEMPSEELVGCSAGKMGQVLSVDIASQKAIAAARTVSEFETQSLMAANNRVCATHIRSAIDLPVFANSAMDGYAINRRDLAGDGPWTLPVAGRLAAGDGAVLRLTHKSAMQIMTGAPVPSGANCVVMQEHCERLGNSVVIRERPAHGKHIRFPGEDIRASTILVNAGDLLTARHLALLAASGCSDVNVHARVKVGLISTGSELVEPGTPLAAGQIYNSNRTYLKARLDRPWIDIVDFGIVDDNPGKIQTIIRKAAQECDVIISTGGVSAGEEDHMLDVLRREAAELDVLKVAMRPGKPVTVGRLGAAMYFGLPGNPFACAITFMQIAWPAIRKTAGLEPRDDNRFKGIADFIYLRKPGRTEYLPITWSRTDEYGRPFIERLGKGSSASLHPFTLAKAIATVPSNINEVQPGDVLTLEPIDF